MMISFMETQAIYAAVRLGLPVKQGNQPDQGRFSDIYMMAILGGRERTEGDFNNLLRDAAFALLKIIPTSSPWVIIEGDPV